MLTFFWEDPKSVYMLTQQLEQGWILSNRYSPNADRVQFEFGSWEQNVNFNIYLIELINVRHRSIPPVSLAGWAWFSDPFSIPKCKIKSVGASKMLLSRQSDFVIDGKRIFYLSVASILWLENLFDFYVIFFCFYVVLIRWSSDILNPAISLVFIIWIIYYL